MDMFIRSLLASVVVVVLETHAAIAQQPPTTAAEIQPKPGCIATPQQVQANKRVAMAFFTAATPEARVALADPTYKQHNPVFVKRAQVDHLSDYEEFRRTFSARASSAQDSGGAPSGNLFEIVTAECDIVTIVHRKYVQDPTAPAGTYYPIFTFDAFRVTRGKLAEHWDGAQISPPG
jgi:predicted SnoaL-like aldol condensation-catalyzing enzyme